MFRRLDKTMYTRQSRNDVYEVAMNYLVNNSVVESSFSINDLIQDFRKHRDMKS